MRYGVANASKALGAEAVDRAQDPRVAEFGLRRMYVGLCRRMQETPETPDPEWRVGRRIRFYRQRIAQLNAGLDADKAAAEAASSRMVAVRQADDQWLHGGDQQQWGVQSGRSRSRSPTRSRRSRSRYDD